MNIFNKISTIFRRNVRKPETIIYPEYLDGTYKYIKTLLENPNQIYGVCQIFTKIKELEPDDLNTIKNLEAKYGINIQGTIYKQTNPLSHEVCIKKNRYYIQEGWRFSFKGKTLDILEDCNGSFLLGNPEGQDQYILNRYRDYQGKILLTSQNCPALVAVFETVSAKLMHDLLGEPLSSGKEYNVDLDMRTFSRI